VSCRHQSTPERSQDSTEQVKHLERVMARTKKQDREKELPPQSLQSSPIEQEFHHEPPLLLAPSRGNKKPGALLFLLARGDAGMWRLEGKWALLLGERGETGKPTTAHTCTHEERESKGEAKGGGERVEGRRRRREKVLKCLELKGDEKEGAH
jgi:hypothetical protein